MKKNLQDQVTLAQRLAGYAASAGALAAISVPTHASIVYSGVQDSVLTDIGDMMLIDLDANLTPDFAIMIGGSSSTSGTSSTYQRSVFGYGVVVNALSGTTYQNSWAVRLDNLYGGYYGTSSYLPIVDHLGEGSIVDDNRDSWSNLQYPFIPAALAFGGYTSTYYGSISSNIYGDFSNREGYIGVRFNIDGSQHYGWIRVSLGSFISPLTVHDWAYEDTPDTRILTGNTGTPQDLSPTILFTLTSSSEFVHEFTLLASESITGLEISDIQVSNGTPSNLVEVTPGLEYSLTVTASSVGFVEITVPANSITDGNTNPNEELSYGFIMPDLDPPVPELTLSEEGYTNQAVNYLEIDFGENVNDFEIDSIVVTNGSIQYAPLKDQNYFFIVTADTEGEVTVQVPADIVEDDSGNGNTEASVSWVFDETAPVGTFATLPDTAYTPMVTVTLDFDEEVSGLTIDSLTVTNGTPGNLVEVTPGLSYTVDITASAEGTVTVELNDAAVTDMAMNESGIASTSWEYVIIPIAELEVQSYNLNTAMHTINISFSETISGIELGDITVTNGTAGNLVEITAGTEYSVDVTATADGTVTLTLAAGAVQADSDGDENIETSINWEYEYRNALNETLAEGIDIYPNPASQNLHLRVAEISDVKLIDLNGRTVYHQQEVLNEVIDVSGFNTGVYILQVSADNHTTQHRVVIN